MTIKHAAIAIVPCNDLDESQVFYQRLGFEATAIYPHHGYRILQDDPSGTLVRVGWPADSGHA